jgi:chromatin remodeling complex protein RSC6
MESTKSSSSTNKMPSTKKTVATKKVEVEAPAPAPVVKVKKTRVTKKAVVEAPAPAPAVELPAVEAPVKKVRATKKVAPAVEVEAEVETEVKQVDTRSAEEVLTDLQASLKLLGQDLVHRIRDSVKEALLATKVLKREARDVKKRKHKDPETMTPEERDVYEKRRANNAFLKPRPLTDELCVFMGLPSGSHKSQTDVTKFISAYVKEHSCFDPTFKRTILPDQKLGKLLRANDGDVVTYLNLQKFLKVHFIKTAPAVTASA